MHARSRSIALVLVCVSALALAGAACGGGHHKSSPTPTPTPAVAATITAISPGAARPGTVVVVTGTSFGATQGTSTVMFGNAAATASSWSATSISVAVPPAASLGAGDTLVTVVNDVGPSNAVSFYVELPQVFYVNDQSTPDAVSGYSLDGAGSITPLAGSPWPLGGTYGGFGGDASSLWVNPHTRRVYATVNTAVAAFNIDDSTGALTAVPGSPFGTATTANYGVTTNPEGTLVFVAGYGADALAVFSVGSNGVLTPVAGSPFPTQVGGNPDGLAMSRDGKFLYSNQEGTQALLRYSVATDGTLMLLGSSMNATASNYVVRAHPTLDALYQGGDNTGLIGYQINATSGNVTPMSGSPWTVPSSMSVTVSRDGKRVYVGGFDHTLSGFDVAADGTLTQMSWSPLTTTAVAGISVDLNADGSRLVAVEQAASGPMHVYAIGSSGAPTEIGTATLGDVAASSPEHISFAR